jgi:hypothetical protein
VQRVRQHLKNETSIQCTDAGIVGLFFRKYNTGGDIHERKGNWYNFVEGNFLASVIENILSDEKWYKE